MSTDAERYKDAFIDLMGHLREIAEAEGEDADVGSPYSRGRASGIHAVLLAVDTILQAAGIDRKAVGLEDLSAESWYER